MAQERIFTKHAEDRMRERNVNHSEVLHVIDNPTVTTPGKGEKVNLWGTVNGRRLRVTILGTDTRIKVITVVDPDEET